MDEPWRWQIDSHHINHINLNYFDLKDQVVTTPAFWGAEPAVADRGPYAGWSEFDTEIRAGVFYHTRFASPKRALIPLTPRNLW